MPLAKIQSSTVRAKQTLCTSKEWNPKSGWQTRNGSQSQSKAGNANPASARRAVYQELQKKLDRKYHKKL